VAFTLQRTEYEVPKLVLRAIAAVFRDNFTTRAGLMAENRTLRQQLNVLRRKAGRLRR